MFRPQVGNIISLTQSLLGKSLIKSIVLFKILSVLRVDVLLQF